MDDSVRRLLVNTENTIRQLAERVARLEQAASMTRSGIEANETRWVVRGLIDACGHDDGDATHMITSGSVAGAVRCCDSCRHVVARVIWMASGRTSANGERSTTAAAAITAACRHEAADLRVGSGDGENRVEVDTCPTCRPLVERVLHREFGGEQRQAGRPVAGRGRL